MHSSWFYPSLILQEKPILQTWSFTLIMMEAVGLREDMETLYVRFVTPTRAEMTGWAGDEWSEVIDSWIEWKTHANTHTHTQTHGCWASHKYKHSAYKTLEDECSLILTQYNQKFCLSLKKHKQTQNTKKLQHIPALSLRLLGVIPLGQTTSRDQGRVGMKRQWRGRRRGGYKQPD